MSMWIKSLSGTVPVSSVMIKPLTVTKIIKKNGTYMAIDDNAEGYSMVTVSVPPSSIDTSFLPESDSSKIVSSTNIGIGGINSIFNKFYTNLTADNINVTCYCATKCEYGDKEIVSMCVPYANSNGNNPSFYTDAYSSAVYATIYGGNELITGILLTDYHVYAMSLNNSTKKVRYFVDGVYRLEKIFINSGSYVVIGAGDKNGSSYSGRNPSTLYFGVVSKCESDDVVIANSLEIMSKLNL